MSPVPIKLTRVLEKLLPATVVRSARVAVFDRRRRRYPRRIVEHTFAGVPHKVLIASSYGERYDGDYPQLAEIAWLAEGRLRRGAKVLNLGASYGVVAMMLGDVVGPEGKVVALEAHPADAATLRRNRELNGMTQLECVHAAVARESGAIALGAHGSVDDGTHRWGRMPVPAFSIDDLSARHGVPDVVFMDVEGYELEALRGAAETLAMGPEWFVEVHEPAQLAAYGAECPEVLDMLTGAGYHVWTMPDAGFELGPDGVPRARGRATALHATPEEVFAQRFFALASRDREAGGSAPQ